MSDRSDGADRADRAGLRDDTDAAGPRDFVLTRGELIEAHRAVLVSHYRRWNAWFRTLFLAAAVSAGVASAGGDIVGSLVTGAGMLIVFPLFVYALGVPWQVRRTMKHDRRFRKPWSFAVEPDALRIWTANGDMRHLWGAVTSRIDTPHLVLLMTGAATFIPLPLRALGPDDLDAIARRLRDAPPTGHA